MNKGLSCLGSKGLGMNGDEGNCRGKRLQSWRWLLKARPGDDHLSQDNGEPCRAKEGSDKTDV